MTMGPTNKDSGATRMAGGHMLQAVKHTDLDDRPSGNSRLSEEASTLPAARGAEQQGGRRQRHANHNGGFD
jgi:hypothetical protein